MTDKQTREPELNSKLLDAHARGDGLALVSLYEAAGRLAERDKCAGAAGFYMTQAYVFALETGSKKSARLKAWLIANNRECET